MSISMAAPPCRSPIRSFNSITTRRPRIPSKFCTGILPFPPLRPPKQQFSCRGAPSEPVTDSFRAVAEGRAAWITESGQFSVSDSQLDSRGFELHRTVDDLDLDRLNALFAKVGFPRRQTEKLRFALRNTSSLMWLRYKKSGKVVAFARATGDDVFNAIIWDVVVDPSFQGCGLGKAVMERLLADLLGKGITNIALYAEPNVLGFYRPLGFAADPDGIKAMVYSKKSQRSS